LDDCCNDSEVCGVKGTSHDGSSTHGGCMIPQSIATSNMPTSNMPIMNSGMTSAINHYEGKLLTPTASQLSLHTIRNSSANFSLQSKTGRTHYSHHHLNSNHADHVLLKGPPESESSSYPSSD
jgi:hypothetical protein